MEDKQAELKVIDGLIRTMTAAYDKMVPFTMACHVQLTLADVCIMRRALELYREKVDE